MRLIYTTLMFLSQLFAAFFFIQTLIIIYYPEGSCREIKRNMNRNMYHSISSWTSVNIECVWMANDGLVRSQAWLCVTVDSGVERLGETLHSSVKPWSVSDSVRLYGCFHQSPVVKCHVLIAGTFSRNFFVALFRQFEYQELPGSWYALRLCMRVVRNLTAAVSVMCHLVPYRY